ncbi:MAG: protein kinase [Myxococcota bacterium]
MAVPLGPFTLQHPIGRGGMGVVWLGRHEAQQIPVAVKVITGAAAASEDYHRAFHQEVRAVSSLDHPGVVWIFEYGRIPAESAAASNGELTVGSPYLVMEHASHGTLRQLTRLSGWSEARAILMALLDALAHAHARGVLHRDLKPDNVLVAGGEDLRPGIKITDFGIARPLDDTAVGEARPVGTPQYMAPEQIRNEPDATGPHTDIYALGTLAWRLVTGRLPFHGARGPALMYAQLNRPPGPLEPQFAVPVGLETVLRTMLAKEPYDRFRCAADAALALASLPDPTEPGDGATSSSIRLSAQDDEIDLDTATLKVVVGQLRGRSLAPLGPSVHPPFPTSWRLPPTSSRPARLLGAGLGLFGVRPVPLVAREPERDELWSRLLTVHHERRAAVVVVRGPAGVGRTRLARWLAERAHEVGGAVVVSVAFTSAETAPDQLRRALGRAVRSAPLSPLHRAERFGPLFDGFGAGAVPPATALEQLLDPAVAPLRESERRALVRRVCEALAVERPLLLVFDDAHLWTEALRWAEELLSAQQTRPSPVMVVLTVADPSLAPDTERARSLEALARAKGASELALAPLEGEHRLELVHEILGLEPALAEGVAERTGGNPLFAVQLVADWVDRDLLRPTPCGYTLTSPAPPWPGSMRDVWDWRIRSLVSGLEPPALELLERAALLGGCVDALEWQAVCDDTDGRHAATRMAYFNPRHARLRAALMERLLTKQLAVPTDTGFAFAQEDFRAALLIRAESSGRYRGHARAASAVLVHAMTDADADRVGRLLADSGRVDEALDALFRAEAHRRRTGGMPAALELLGEIERVLRDSRVPNGRRGWAEFSARRATALAAVGRPAEAARAARSAARLAGAGGWTELQATAAAVLAAVTRDPQEAEHQWLEAARLVGDPPLPAQVGLAAKAWHRLRRRAHARGDRSLARARGEALSKLLPRAESDADRALILGAMAEGAWSDGRLDEACALAEAASGLAAGHGDLAGEAKARSILAEVALLRGDTASARVEWERAAILLESFGATRHAALARCREGLTSAQLGDFAHARDVGERILGRGEPTDPVVRAAVHALLTLAAAGRGRWERFDAHARVCEALFPHLRSAHDREYTDAMMLAGTCAAERNQRGRALRALALAQLRAVALGDSDRIGAVQQRIGAVGG